MNLILASRSPRRQELLKLITTDFICCPSHAKEPVAAGVSPDTLVQNLAYTKAKAVQPQYPQDLILGCDTVVVAPNGEICGIPKSRADAKAMLQTLSGNTHRVVTGVCLLCEGREYRYAEETKVTFYPLSDAELEGYLDTEEYKDKAGGYGIQGKGSLLVSGICGSYHNVVGLPVGSLVKALQEFYREAVK